MDAEQKGVWGNLVEQFFGVTSAGAPEKNSTSESAPSKNRYSTPLSPNEEKQFQTWVTTRRKQFPNSPMGLWRDTPDADYDMRGYWKATGGQDWKPGQHLRDTWKTPYHRTFSVESKYAVGKDRAKAGFWVGEGSDATFVPPGARFDPDFGLRYSNDPAYYSMPRGTPRQERLEKAGVERKEFESLSKERLKKYKDWVSEAEKTSDIPMNNIPEGIAPELGQRLKQHVLRYNQVVDEMNRVDELVQQKKMTQEQSTPFWKELQSQAAHLDAATKILRRDILNDVKTQINTLESKEKL